MSTRNQLRAACEHLGVRMEDVERQPIITPQLRKLARDLQRLGEESVPKNWSKTVKAMLVGTPIYYLKASDSPDARLVLDAYYSISGNHRKVLPLEAFCLAAGVPTSRIFEIIVGTAVRLGARTSTVIAAVSHPAVVRKTIEMALTDAGLGDRNTLHKAVGFLPAAKGAQTNITIAQNASAQATGGSASAAAIAGRGHGLAAPPPEQTIRRLVDRFNDARLLPAAPAAPALESHETLPDVVEATAEMVEIGDEDGD